MIMVTRARIASVDNGGCGLEAGLVYVPWLISMCLKVSSGGMGSNIPLMISVVL
jgi:hypothetical protein